MDITTGKVKLTNQNLSLYEKTSNRNPVCLIFCAFIHADFAVISTVSDYEEVIV